MEIIIREEQAEQGFSYRILVLTFVRLQFTYVPIEASRISEKSK